MLTTAVTPAGSRQPDAAGGRAAYFEPRVSDALYGSSVDSCSRVHRRLNAMIDDVTVIAAEFVRLPGIVAEDHALLVLHLELGEDPIASLGRATDLRRNTARLSATRAFVDELLPPDLAIFERQVRAQSIAHVTFNGELPDSMPEAYQSWSADRQWLWQLAAAPYSVFPPDPADILAFEQIIPFSRDWRALVLRDGSAFLGMTPDDGSAESFHAQAELYVHTIYLDALLMGRIQRIAFASFAETVKEAHTAQLASWAGESLEFRLARLRVSFWSSHLSFHSRANDLIISFQRQNSLPELLERIATDLENFSRLLAAVSTRRLNAVLGLVSVVGFPLTTAFAAGQIWAAASPLAVGVWASAATIAAVVILLVSPTIRGLVTSSWRRTPLRVVDRRRPSSATVGPDRSRADLSYGGLHSVDGEQRRDGFRDLGTETTSEAKV